MEQKKIYIQAAQQISIQQPLSEQWIEQPESYSEPFVNAINPAFREYLPVNEVRRMSNIMKRALITGIKVLKDTGIEHPDAIITGTSYGCLSYTEKFLDALIENDEETLSPTYFMQSTHNTVSSALAIYTKTHGYNVTYSQGCSSFDLSLQDAWMQMQLGKIKTALVGGHEETYESFSEQLKRTGFVGVEGMVPCGDMAMSMMLNTAESGDNLCELVGIRIAHNPSVGQLKNMLDKLLSSVGIAIEDVSAVMTGVNGNTENDKPYEEVVSGILPATPLLHFKHIFGENFVASGLGTYAAAHILKNGNVPEFMYADNTPDRCNELKSIVLLNINKGHDCSVTLLKK